MQTIDILTFGDLIADILLPIPLLPIMPDQVQLAHGIYLEPGGMANFLIMARRLGATVAPVGRFGDDLYGQTIFEKLKAEGVDVSSIEMLAGKQTTLAFVFVSDAGEHVFLGVLGTSRMDAESTQRTGALIAQSRGFYTNGYAFLDADPPQLVILAMRMARLAQVPVYFDPGPQIQHLPADWFRDAIAETNTLFMTKDEAAFWTGKSNPREAAVDLLSTGPETVVLKLGSEGCLICSANEILSVPAFPVAVCDTSGAGDAFDAAFITAIQKGLTFIEAGSLSNAVGAVAVTKMGAGTRLPQSAEIFDLLKANQMNIPFFQRNQNE